VSCKKRFGQSNAKSKSEIEIRKQNCKVDLMSKVFKIRLCIRRLQKLATENGMWDRWMWIQKLGVPCVCGIKC